jgi:hypothetical protein
VIDVDAVMADLRGRVAEKKARGLYGVDALIVDRPPAAEPFSPEELERVRGLAVLHYDMVVGPSTKPLLGRLVTKVKSTLVRGVSQPGFSLTAQLNAYHGSLVAYIARMAHEITRLQQELVAVRAEAVRATDAVREAEIDRQRDLGQMEGRLEELADRLRAAEARLAHVEGGDPPQG